VIRTLVAIGCAASLAVAAAPRGCTGSASLGTFRIAVARAGGGNSLPVKAVSLIPAGSRLQWDPAHLSPRLSSKSEVTVILASAQDKVLVLPVRKAAAHADWILPSSPKVIALVVGPQGLNMGKVASLVKHNDDLLEQLADYAEQTSEVEALVQELADSEQSGKNTDAALKGFSAQYAVALPKLDTKASSDQQAALLLRAVLPTANTYDPLAPTSAQMQQSVGLAASVAGLFFGNGVALAAGGTALVTNLKTALFPSTEIRSAFAQSTDPGTLALCTKNAAAKSRTRIAYLWAYRVPNAEPPPAAISGTAHVPLGAASMVACSGPVKELERAHEWRLVPLSGGSAIPVTVAAGAAPNAIRIDLTDTKAAPGEYRLTASWDWDSLSVGKVHLHPYADFRQVRVTPESRAHLVEGSGTVSLKLIGADFEFVEKAAMESTGARKPAPKPVEFELPKGRRAGEQTSMDVDIDTAARGAYKLLLAQSDGREHEIPVTILPPRPKISNLPLRVNTGEAEEAIRLEGSGLDQVESASSDAGEISGEPEAKGWSGHIRLKAGLRPGDRFPLVLKIKGTDAPLTVADAVEVVGPRPRIAGVRRSTAGSPGLEMREKELAAGASIGMVLQVEGFHDGARPRLELACRSGEMRKALALSPDEPASGATLSFAGPGQLYLAVDPGAVGYSGCVLAAAIEIQPEGRSDPLDLGRVVRLPRLEQFTLTAEPLGPATYAGLLKGTDLDLVEKAGWDAEHGLAVDAIPAPVAGEPGKQTLRIALPWPAPAPHAPLYVWLRGEKEGRRAAVAW
jgi:hypothetical protein